MPDKKKRYKAVREIQLGKPNPEVTVRPGDPLPEKVTTETLKDLLDCGDIEEVA